MSDQPGDEVKLGKKFAGEKFATIKSMADIEEEIGLRQLYGEHPEAMSIEAYFSHRRIHDPIHQSMRLAFTKVRIATVFVFDDIFSTF